MRSDCWVVTDGVPKLAVANKPALMQLSRRCAHPFRDNITSVFVEFCSKHAIFLFFVASARVLAVV